MDSLRLSPAFERGPVVTTRLAEISSGRLAAMTKLPLNSKD